MSLEMRVECERCHAALGHGDLVFICSHECTFCPSCTASTTPPFARSVHFGTLLSTKAISGARAVRPRSSTPERVRIDGGYRFGAFWQN